MVGREHYTNFVKFHSVPEPTFLHIESICFSQLKFLSSSTSKHRNEEYQVTGLLFIITWSLPTLFLRL